MKAKIVTFGIILMMLIVALSGCINNEEKVIEEKTTPSQANLTVSNTLNETANETTVNETENIVIFAKSGGGSSGGSSSSSSTTTPAPVPTPEPILTANAGGPYTGIVNELIIFNGSASFDPAGNITNYTWDFGDVLEYGMEVTHTYNVVGNYTVNLTITNGVNTTATDMATVAISDPEDPAQPGNLIWNQSLSKWEGSVIDEPVLSAPFGAETNVGGKVIYGTGWTAPEAGFYRITFSFENGSNIVFDKNTVIYHPVEETETEAGNLVSVLSDLIDIQHEDDPTAPVANDTNCLSYPVIYSEYVRPQRGTFGVEKFDGIYYWTWGYLNPDPRNPIKDFKFKQPLSCLPGVGNNPNSPETATCELDSETVDGEIIPGNYSGNYSVTLYTDGVVASFIQKQPENEWQAESFNATEPVYVSHVDFGDNIEVVTWNTNNQIRLEVAMFQEVTDPMIGYTMLHTLLHGADEVWGTTTVRYDNYMPVVYSSHAHLTVQKLADDFEIIRPAPDSDNAPVGGVGVIVYEHNVAYIDVEIVEK